MASPFQGSTAQAPLSDVSSLIPGNVQHGPGDDDPARCASRTRTTAIYYMSISLAWGRLHPESHTGQPADARYECPG